MKYLFPLLKIKFDYTTLGVMGSKLKGKRWSV